MTAFLERSQKLQDSPDGAINIEYLKNCVFKYMSSTRRSDRMRLYPVIATILKLTPSEREEIDSALKSQASYASQFASSLSAVSSASTPSHGSNSNNNRPISDGSPRDEEQNESLLGSLGAYATSSLGNLFG